jgi:ApaG protein
MRAMHTYFFECVVETRYLPEHSAPQDERYAFAYTVTIVNRGRVPAQLIARHWVIVDGRGHTEEVKGLGVVGQQPLLKPGQAFEYTSGAVIRTPLGSMRGSYFCVAEDGERFEADIPVFALMAEGGDASTGRLLH